MRSERSMCCEDPFWRGYWLFCLMRPLCFGKLIRAMLSAICEDSRSVDSERSLMDDDDSEEWLSKMVFIGSIKV